MSNYSRLLDKLNNLPYGFWEFRGVNSRTYTHGIHTYPAVMISPISKAIIEMVQEAGFRVSSLMDPYMGSGTVLVEAHLHSIRHIYGNDLNPLARFIGSNKLKTINYHKIYAKYKYVIRTLDRYRTEYKDIIENVDTEISKEYDLAFREGWGIDATRILQEYIDKSSVDLDIPYIKNMGYWFKPSVIISLQVIKNVLNTVTDKEIREYMFVAFSETIRFVSNRRNGEFKLYRIKAEQISDFTVDVFSKFERLLKRNIEKLRVFNEYNDTNKIKTNIHILAEDTKELSGVPDNSIDLMVTSPPYGDSKTTVAYGQFSRLSLEWLDMFNLSGTDMTRLDTNLMGGTKYNKGFTSNIESSTLDEALNRINNADPNRAGDVFSFYKDLEDCMVRIDSKMKKGSLQFWVVGNRTVRGVKLLTDKIISEIASTLGLKTMIIMEHKVPKKTMPSKNSPSNIRGEVGDTMCSEHIVVLYKPK